MMLRGVIFAVASVLASSALAEGGHVGGCADARGPVDWVDPTIGATSHMLVPAYPTVSVPFGMYRFTPPAPWFTVDEFGEVPLFLPAHRATCLFALRFGEGRLTFDNRKVTPYSFCADVDSHGFALRLVPTAKGAAIQFDGAGFAADKVSFRAAKSSREGNVVRLEDSFRGVAAYFYGEFSGEGGRELRFAVSWISPEQAEANFRAELAGRTLDELESAARRRWNDALGRIAVEGADDSRRRVFYTALYRCHERMVDITEDGRSAAGTERSMTRRVAASRTTGPGTPTGLFIHSSASSTRRCSATGSTPISRWRLRRRRGGCRRSRASAATDTA